MDVESCLGVRKPKASRRYMKILVDQLENFSQFWRLWLTTIVPPADSKQFWSLLAELNLMEKWKTRSGLLGNFSIRAKVTILFSLKKA